MGDVLTFDCQTPGKRDGIFHSFLRLGFCQHINVSGEVFFLVSDFTRQILDQVKTRWPSRNRCEQTGPDGGGGPTKEIAAILTRMMIAKRRNIPIEYDGISFLWCFSPRILLSEPLIKGAWLYYRYTTRWIPRYAFSSTLVVNCSRKT